MAVDLPTFSRYLSEAYKLSALQANRVQLTAEEREKVMSAKAVWHHGKNGEATPAIWKSSDSQGNPIYVTNTHRAMAAEKTIDAAIRKFHSYVKDSA